MSKRLVALFGAGVIVLAACGAQTSPTPAAGTPTAPPVSQPTSGTSATPGLPDLTNTTYKAQAVGHTGGTLIFAEWQAIDTLNPYYAQAETDIEAASPALIGLLNTTVDLKYVGFPYMAMSDNVPLTSNGGVVVNGTKMDVTYQIHPGFKWSDGTDVTCKDVEATWKWNMDPAQSGLAGGTTGWEDIESVEDAGGGKCVIHFKDIYEGYLGLFTSPIFPAAYLAKVPVKDAPTKLYPLTDVASGVYNGPYIPTKYTTGAQLEYGPNKNYFQVTGKTQAFDKLIFKYYSDADAMKAGFLQNEYDIGVNLNHSDLPSLTQETKCNGQTNGTPTGCNLVVTDTFTYENHSIQNRSLAKKFGQADVDTIKQALNLATDKKEITTRALGGTVDPQGPNNISPLFWYYKDEGTWPGAQPDKAASLLDAAGWAVGADGFRSKNGVQLALDYCTTQRPYRVDTLGLVAAQMAKIGIKVNAKPVPANPDLFGGWDAVAADTPCNLIHGNYDVAMFAWVAPFDPLGSYNVYTCGGIPEDNPTHSGQNNTRTCDPALDAAWNQVKGNVDLAKVRDGMWAVQDFYTSHVIEIPLFYWKNAYLVNPKLHNIVGNLTTSEVFGNLDDIWSEGQ